MFRTALDLLGGRTGSSSFVLVWVPSVDGSDVFAGMLYAVKGSYGFEHSVFCAARVLNASRVGSQKQLSESPLNPPRLG